MEYSIYALAAAALISVAAILAKLGSKKAEPSVAAGLSVTVMTICAYILSEKAVRAVHIFSLNKRVLLFVLIAGIVTGVAALCFFKALHTGEAMQVVPVWKLSIIFTMLFGVIWWHNKFGTNQIIATILCLAGIVIIVVGNNKKWQWFLFAIIAALLMSAVEIVEDIGISGIGSGALRFFELVIGAVLIWIVAIVTGGGKKLRSISFLDGVFTCLSGLAVAGSWICLSRAQALKSGLLPLQIYRVNLLITVILAAVILKEKISGRKILGALLFIAGVEILLFKSPIF